MDNRINEPIIKQPRWKEPLYSKKKIDWAGEIMCSSPNPYDQIEAATKIIDNWRASHAYPKNHQEFKRTNRNESQGVFGVYGDSGENVRRLGGGQTDSARIYSQIIGVSVEV